MTDLEKLGIWGIVALTHNVSLYNNVIKETGLPMKMHYPETNLIISSFLTRSQYSEPDRQEQNVWEPVFQLPIWHTIRFYCWFYNSVPAKAEFYNLVSNNSVINLCDPIIQKQPYICKVTPVPDYRSFSNEHNTENNQFKWSSVIPIWCWCNSNTNHHPCHF